ncbi:MAG: cytochrome c3 family protein [Bryobacteraceae bacterium]
MFQWPTSKDEFDHKTTGYLLEGSHAGLSCTKCHNPSHISTADRKRIMVKDLSRTFQGLHPACLTCHEDRHAGQLGKDCARCHNTVHWKPILSFDHNATKYPLTGRHEQVECNKCHRPMANDAKVIQYTSLNFATCAGCHQDPHRGAFEARCESCHTTSSWRRVQMTSAFDHSRTKFPLTGKHEGVACLKCHKDSNFKTPVAHGKCMDCHQDQHQGQFAHRADGGECGTCHTDAGWRPSTFTETSHRLTAYPLTGKHAAVACAKCHTPAGTQTDYHPRYRVCLDCHKDVHAGQFAGRPHENRCEDCHNVNGFEPSTFTLTQHQSLAFTLKGSHSAVACLDCHRKEDAPGGADRRFHFASQACTTCHEDPHRDEFSSEIRAAVKAGQDLCETCHGLRSWQELKPFDHSMAGFRLEGAHTALRCGDCHRPNNLNAGRRDLPFKGAPERCEGCHEDIHGGQFQRGGAPIECGVCHNVNQWTAGRFDHESNTAFSLKGAHEKVPCRLCHSSRQEISGRMVVTYKGTPRECAACHR